MEKLSLNVTSEMSMASIKQYVGIKTGMLQTDFYLLLNGKILNQNIVKNCNIHIMPRILGGKGGFGSMLRAIGAQIEKTTNREACRDLSGRRLRDINEEKRVKDYLAKGSPNTEDTEERKKRKLQRLCQAPKSEFKDENYEKHMAEMTETVSDAVECGFKASTSSTAEITKKKIKGVGYFDSDLDTDSDNETEDGEEDAKLNKTKQSDNEQNITENVNKRKSLNMEDNNIILTKKCKLGNL